VHRGPGRSGSLFGDEPRTCPYPPRCGLPSDVAHLADVVQSPAPPNSTLVVVHCSGVGAPATLHGEQLIYLSLPPTTLASTPCFTTSVQVPCRYAEHGTIEVMHPESPAQPAHCTPSWLKHNIPLLHVSSEQEASLLPVQNPA